LHLTPEKAEIVGALLGDKIRFGFFKRYGNWTKSKRPRGMLEICLGSNAQWGKHLSDLAFRAYGLRGSNYLLQKPWPRQPEWRFSISSPRVVKDLLPYFDPMWRAGTWRIVPAIFEAPKASICSLLRGYMDADGFVHKSPTRGVRVESVNENGINDVLGLFAKLGIRARIYRRKSRNVWTLQIGRRQNISRYRELVGFSLPHKSTALDTVWQHYTK